MSNKKIHNLTQSKVFCMAPWIHIHNLPSGDIMPCCISKWGDNMGNLYDDSIETIWNNDNYKTLRYNMLNDIPVNSCSRCYKEEEWGNKSSYRKNLNFNYSNVYNELVEKATDKNGFNNKMEFRRWDFRFSNLCNLACTSCGTGCSSAWVEIENKMYQTQNKIKFKTSKQDISLFINTIKSQANIVDHVYFAGGEPLIQPEHYEILNYIDNIGRLDKINFTYSTNLTSLTYKSTNVIDYWNKIKNIKVLVSLDEIDTDRLYYIRYPAKLNNIIDNIRILNKNFTGNSRKWMITPTWSLMNMHRIKEIVSFFKDNNLLPNAFANTIEWEEDLHNIILMNPPHLSISAATPEWKIYLKTKLEEYADWYLTEMIPLKNNKIKEKATQVFLNNIKRFYNALNETVNIDSSRHKDWYSKLDNARNTNFLETFPELLWNIA